MNLTRPTALVATGLFLTVLAVPQFRASNRLGASGLPAGIDRVRPAVVQLKFIFTGPSPNIPGRADVSPLSMGALGSGFLVGNGYVITARHVIEGFQSFAAQFGQEYTKKALKIAVQMPVENERASFCGFDYDVVAEDERHDLTLLKARNWPSDQTMRCGPMINGKQTTFKVRGATLSRDIRPREGESVQYLAILWARTFLLPRLERLHPLGTQIGKTFILAVRNLGLLSTTSPTPTLQMCTLTVETAEVRPTRSPTAEYWESASVLRQVQFNILTKRVSSQS